MFSPRSEIATETNALTAALEARRAAGESVLDLTRTNPTETGFEALTPAIAHAMHDALAGPYVPDPLGLPEARAALAAALAHDPDHILLTSSTSEAYAHLLRLLCEPGAEVLVPQPSYPLLAHLAAYTDVHLAGYPLEYDGGWSVDFAALYDAITPRTRAIVAISPNNPTGQFLPPDALSAMSSLGLPVIVDEVFSGYPLDGPVPGPMLEPEGLVFRLDGLSKRAGLPQLKLAWTSVHGPRPWVAEAMHRLSMMLDTFLSPASAVQRALPALLEASVERRERIRARCLQNLAALREHTRSTALTVPRVEGGWTVPVRVPATRTDEAWALRLLECGVQVHPGYFYDFEGAEAWLVLSLLTPRADFEAGVQRLVEVVEAEA